jgi:hypothetical protein
LWVESLARVHDVRRTLEGAWHRRCSTPGKFLGTFSSLMRIQGLIFIILCNSAVDRKITTATLLVARACGTCVILLDSMHISWLECMESAHATFSCVFVGRRVTDDGKVLRVANASLADATKASARPQEVRPIQNL